MKNKVITIDLGDTKYFYNEFNHEELASPLVEYIDRELTKTDGKRPITININLLNEVSEDAKNEMVDTLHRHYGHRVQDRLFHKKYDDLKSIYLIAIGVLIIIVADISRNLEAGFITDLIYIVGSFIILQALTDIIFADANRRLSLRRKRQMAKCHIEFLIKKEK